MTCLQVGQALHHHGDTSTQLSVGQAGMSAMLDYVRLGVVVSAVCCVLGSKHRQTSLTCLGQAIAAAVSSSCAVVVVASPAYLASAVTVTELHILADTLLRSLGPYPVIVLCVAPDTRQQVEFN